MSKPTKALNLDINSQRNLIRFYENLKEKSRTTVRFFDFGEFYAVFGSEDTGTVAKELSRAPGGIKFMAPGGCTELPYVSLSKGNFEMSARELLLVRNYRVEVYTIDKGSKSGAWNLEYKGSPGNLSQFEDLLFSSTQLISGNCVIAINLKTECKQKILGLSCIDINDCCFSVTEFSDDDFFSELEAIVVLLGPKECIVPSTDADFERIAKVMERNGVLLTKRKKSDFDFEKSDLIQDLNNLIKFEKGALESANALPEISNTIAMGGLAAAIKYLELTSDSANLGNFVLKQLDLKRFVRMDAAAISALNLLPQQDINTRGAGTRFHSILGVLDRCQTSQGHRLMEKWVKQPLRSETMINDRHTIVQCFVESPSILEEMHGTHLKRLPDIVLLAKKLMRKKANLQDIVRIYQTILRIPRIIMQLNELENSVVTSTLSDPLRDTLQDLKNYKQMVEQVVDFENGQRGEYLMKPSFDKDLETIGEKLKEISDKMDRALTKAADELELDKGSTIKLDHVAHLGHHFRIALRNEQTIRKNKKYRILDAIKAGVRFTNDRLSDLNEEYTEAYDEYETQQKSLVAEIVSIALTYTAPLTQLSAQVAELDCLVAFAVAATSAPLPYVRPKMLPEGSGVLELKGVRHPCVELMDDISYISNDIYFKDNEAIMYIITGPNMGGKSTFIRSVGTAVLMAHIGSFVPCTEATISMVDAIFGRVGACDKLSKGLSTFMVEMIETSYIVRTATPKSLVIIDELGRGTSTYDGCGIAYSIAEHLAKETRSFTLFATHFHEITEIADAVPAVKNCYMDSVADEKDFTLLYQLKPGAMNKSLGVRIARLANFPENVVQYAEKAFEDFEGKFYYLKTEEDDRNLKALIGILQEFVEIDDRTTDEDRQKMEDEIRSRAKNMNTEYFKKAYPQTFG